MPEYFCYEVIATIAGQTGIEMVYYPDSPLSNDGKVIEGLPYQDGDVLFRVNYFGMRYYRSNKNIRVPVIEDHSHDLLSYWALNSDADWCMASLRKSLPLPEGGMMWSPKGNTLSMELVQSDVNNRIASIRWKGMEMKKEYLEGGNVSKEDFRKRLTETEEWFDTAEPSLMDERSRKVVTEQLDINLWLGAKRRNLEILKRLIDRERCEILMPEHESCTMFSFVMLFEDRTERDKVREQLIASSVYPAILWAVPDDASAGTKDFSSRMLSIHCDGRYTEDDMKLLAEIINQSLLR